MSKMQLYQDMVLDFKAKYNQEQIILDFENFLEIASKEPSKYIRNSADYITDTFNFFGIKNASVASIRDVERFNLFDIKSQRSGPIIGGENVQNEIYKIIKRFQRNSFIDKLILLHGPNGSAKSSTVDLIAQGMERFSMNKDGAVYRFNWIFPSDKEDMASMIGAKTIGFGASPSGTQDSFAYLDESKIAAKLVSEFKENPLYLLPLEQRKKFLTHWIAQEKQIPEEEVEIPKHMLFNGLSKKNQEIFECLLKAYHGNISQVFKHVQVERFFFSKQYRVGIAAVEPQMSIDAYEKQLTLDKNYANLPSILQTISFFQVSGPLVESNRGLLEFSDLLKRPLETFKYLLTTIEQDSINLMSGNVVLDSIFIASTNEKHLDAFKTVPDFASFKGRFEFITVPYLLVPSLEEKIYEKDLENLKKEIHIAPHSVHLLCTWAVMTRLKQPDAEIYPKEYRTLLGKLDPLSKIKLFEGKDLRPLFTREEQIKLKEIKAKIFDESKGFVIYEGRFGASPREIKSILHRAAQSSNKKSLTPMDILEELANISKNRTIYEFLQFEPRGKYHDNHFFVKTLEEYYLDIFSDELIHCMDIAKDEEYEQLLKRYITHVVAEIKKENLVDELSGSSLPPSQSLMDSIEKVLNISIPKIQHRSTLLNRIGAQKLENPSQDINLVEVFEDYLDMIKKHFYLEKKKQIDTNIQKMLMLTANDKSLSREEEKEAQSIFKNMEERFHYTKDLATDCLKFFAKHKQGKVA